MNRYIDGWVLGCIVLILLYVGTIALVVFTWSEAISDVANSTFPRCQEDAVILGQGEFNDGRYEFYICGPSVDDYKY